MGKTLDLTKGNVFMTLLGFSTPFLLSNILQACYGASDLFMVGRFADPAAVCAVAVGSQVMQTITGLAIGLTAGGTVLIAQQFGARDRQGMADATAAMLGVFGALSLLMTLAVGWLVEPVCRAMQVPPQALATTQNYLRICALGIPFIVGYNAVGSILRGLGDSRTPLLLMLAACATNVSTDLVFVGLLHRGAEGAAESTVLAQAVSLVLAFGYLVIHGQVHRYRQAGPRFQPGCALRLLRLGLPIAAQEGLVNLSFLLITAIVNGMGLVASAAVGVVEKLIVFSMLPTTAFASAVAAMAAQNFGAGQVRRARQCLNTGIGLSLLFGTAAFLCAQVNGPGLVSLFTGDAAVIRQGALYLRTYSADCMLVCFVFCMNAFFSGGGQAGFPLLHSAVATFAVRVPLSWLFSRLPGGSLSLVGLAAPAATLVSLVLCRWYLKRHYPVEGAAPHRAAKPRPGATGAPEPDPQGGKAPQYG